MGSILIKGGKVVNRGTIRVQDILVRNGRIERMADAIDVIADQELNAEGLHVFPGLIDDQVHFREPGKTYKADIFSESRAAVAGGVTSFMEMPNTDPPALTQELLEDKYRIAAKNSLANYSFFMGASNDNLSEVLRTDIRNVCGIKVFMGSSTGNMLVDSEKTLDGIFSQAPMLIATLCEDEATIRDCFAQYHELYGDDIPAEFHPLIRPVEGCYKSSHFAVELAKRYNSRLHVLHITTAEELALFDAHIPLEQKRITAEVCVHHLFFSADDYAAQGHKIKCNPAIKERRHRDALWEGLKNGHLDIIATDHAPHTLAEKQQAYTQAPSGLPLVQHALNVLLDFYHQGKITLEEIAHKAAHAPAICFEVDKRGFVEEGYWADIVLVDLEESWQVQKENILYKCGWSPFEGHTFKGKIKSTIVSGHLAWHEGRFNESSTGKRLLFNR